MGDLSAEEFVQCRSQAGKIGAVRQPMITSYDISWRSALMVGDCCPIVTW